MVGDMKNNNSHREFWPDSRECRGHISTHSKRIPYCTTDKATGRKACELVFIEFSPDDSEFTIEHFDDEESYDRKRATRRRKPGANSHYELIEDDTYGIPEGMIRCPECHTGAMTREQQNRYGICSACVLRRRASGQKIPDRFAAEMETQRMRTRLEDQERQLEHQQERHQQEFAKIRDEMDVMKAIQQSNIRCPECGGTLIPTDLSDNHLRCSKCGSFFEYTS